MRWTSLPLLAVLALAALLTGCTLFEDGEGGDGVLIVNPPPGVLNYQAMRDSFDQVWSMVDEQYAYPQEAPVDWMQTRQTYRPQIDALSSREEFRALLLSMLAELQDENVGLRDTLGQVHTHYQSVRAKNFSKPAWQNTINSHGFVEVDSWGFALIDSIGYLSFRTWDPAQFNAGTFDLLFEQMREMKGLVLDLRVAGVPVTPLTRPALDSTGMTLLSEPVLTRFLDQPRELLRVIDPSNGSSAPLQLEPRGAWTFTRPVAVLVGEGTINEGELLAAALGILDHVTVLGDTTAGLAGATEGFALNADWEYVMPTLGYGFLDGTPVQGHGLRPDVEIPWDSQSFDDNRDAVLNSALLWMNEHLNED